MNKKIALTLIVLALASLALTNAGGGNGKITGTITDASSGLPLANVTVILIGEGSALSDSAGRFEFANLEDGRYVVEFEAEGYETLTFSSIKITSGSTVSLQPKMKLSIEKDIELSEASDALHGKALKESASKQLSISGLAGMGAVGGSGYLPLNPPNGQKFWDMYHSGYGTNPFIDTEDDHLSTFGADVSTGSYSLVRNYLTHGSLAPKDAYRVEEFVNYFKTDYAAPKNKTFTFSFESAPSVITKNAQLLKIGLKGREVAAENRKPANLTFVIDVSGSMNIENRLGLVKRTMLMLVDEMKAGDRVGIVTYGTHAQVVLKHTSDKKLIQDAIQSLYSEGSTNAEAGLWEGYKLASAQFDEEKINRVVLCTDGVANNGETSSQGLLSNIERYRKQGITLTACGFGMGNYNDVLIEQLATKGDGTYYYIDDLKEAKRVFVEQLTGTLQVIAKDTKIQVDFDPKVVSRYRLIGYEKRDVKDEDFRNDTIDGGEIGSGHSVTALYEVKLKDADARNIGSISIRYKSPDGKQVDEVTERIVLTPPANAMRQAGFTFLSAVTLYAEIMRESYWAKYREVSEVKTLLEELPLSFRKGYEPYEDFYDMVRMTIRLQKANDLGAK